MTTDNISTYRRQATFAYNAEDNTMKIVGDSDAIQRMVTVAELAAKEELDKVGPKAFGKLAKDSTKFSFAVVGTYFTNTPGYGINIESAIEGTSKEITRTDMVSLGILIVANGINEQIEAGMVPPADAHTTYTSF